MEYELSHEKEILNQIKFVDRLHVNLDNKFKQGLNQMDIIIQQIIRQSSSYSKFEREKLYNYAKEKASIQQLIKECNENIENTIIGSLNKDDSMRKNSKILKKKI